MDGRKRVLVTGAAGFIGFHLSQRLLREGYKVCGLDNLNAYYDPALKQARLDQLTALPGFTFVRMDLQDHDGVMNLWREFRPEIAVNLAAQAGVRHSLTHPQDYIDSNITGFLNVLEACRRYPVRHLLFASSSSVYGGNTKLPYAEEDAVDHPVSLYAATKKSNEMMAHSYAHLFGIPATGLRFFTVYGPWGRPDMAMFKFARAIEAGEPIEVYGEGQMMRDFTYVDDIVDGLVRLLPQAPGPDPAWDSAAGDPATAAAPYRIFNIGNNEAAGLLEMIALLESEMGIPARRKLLPMQPGDVRQTYADISRLKALTGFSPRTPLKEGIGNFVRWYKDYYGLPDKQRRAV